MRFENVVFVLFLNQYMIMSFLVLSFVCVIVNLLFVSLLATINYWQIFNLDIPGWL